MRVIKNAGGQRPRTIGFLGTVLTTAMQNALWQGAMHAVQASGARLVFYPATSLRPAAQAGSRATALYDLVDAASVDGLLLWLGGVVDMVGIAEAARFFARYAAIPLVTIGGLLAERPDLSVDNYHGLRRAIEHLIDVHGCRRIAFIRGPVEHPEAEERFRAYTDALQAHGLPANPDLVAVGAFNFEVGGALAEEATARWLRDYPGELDAIVAATDNMALAAVRAIAAHGLQVPDDIAVVGFDDMDDSRASLPPLTTVRQPFYELGSRAAQTLLAWLDGESQPARVAVPAELVVRESCGCTPRSLELARVLPQDRAAVTPGVARARLVEELGQYVPASDMSAGQWEAVLDLLQDALRTGHAERFIAALKRSLTSIPLRRFDGLAWQNVLSVLRRYALSASGEALRETGETLFNQARVLVAEAAERVHVQRRLEAEREVGALRTSSEALVVSFDQRVFLETLDRRLPRLGFPAFYLALYEDPAHPAAGARLIHAWAEGAPLDLPPDGIRFATSRLIPDSLPQARQTGSLVVAPLYFDTQQLGLLVLEVGPGQGAIYESLRVQVSSALQGSLLLRQVRHHAAQLEDAVTQTTTIAEEMLVVGTQTAEHARAVADAARQSVHVSRTGQETVAKTIEGMQAIQEQVNAIAASLTALVQQTKNIGEIIATVNEVADQSKLLALNAQIEAARAGDAGRGFGVVATEMKYLAEQSRQSTVRVRSILQEIESATNAAHHVMQAGSQGVLHGMELASQAGNAIHDLAATIDAAAQAASEIAVSTQQQRTGIENLVSTMQEIQLDALN